MGEDMECGIAYVFKPLKGKRRASLALFEIDCALRLDHPACCSVSSCIVKIDRDLSIDRRSWAMIPVYVMQNDSNKCRQVSPGSSGQAQLHNDSDFSQISSQISSYWRLPTLVPTYAESPACTGLCWALSRKPPRVLDLKPCHQASQTSSPAQAQHKPSLVRPCADWCRGAEFPCTQSTICDNHEDYSHEDQLETIRSILIGVPLKLYSDWFSCVQQPGVTTCPEPGSAGSRLSNRHPLGEWSTGQIRSCHHPRQI